MRENEESHNRLSQLGTVSNPISGRTSMSQQKGTRVSIFVVSVSSTVVSRNFEATFLASTNAFVLKGCRCFSLDSNHAVNYFLGSTQYVMPVRPHQHRNTRTKLTYGQAAAQARCCRRKCRYNCRSKKVRPQPKNVGGVISMPRATSSSMSVRARDIAKLMLNAHTTKYMHI